MKHGHKLWVSLVFVALLVSMTLQAGNRALASPETAKMSDEFVDSIGVVVHGDRTGTNAYADRTFWEQKLQESGIRNVRSHMIADGRPDTALNHQVIEEVAALGLKWNLLIDPRYGTSPDNILDAITNDQDILDAVRTIEGPNEYDLRGDANWVTTLTDWQSDLYDGVKQSTNQQLAAIPIVGPSIVKWTNPNHYADLCPNGYAACPLYTKQDFANLHPYPNSGNVPDSKKALMEPPLRQYEVGYTMPIIATESGYHNAIRQYTGHVPASETASAKLLPRLFLDFYNEGVVRTYAYELLDEQDNPANDDDQQHFGLIRYDQTVKPAYTAIKNMITLLNDPGSSFTPGSLDYTLSGDVTDVRHLLLQKRDGTYYLALWQNVPVYVTGTSDSNPGYDLVNPDKSVTLTLNQSGVVGELTQYRPNDSINPIGSPIVNPTSVTLSVPDEPLIVKLAPPVPKPDLVVTDISWTPASPSANVPVTFSATIKNQGTAATPSGVISGVKFKVDGVTASFSDNYTTSIPPGGTATVTANGGPEGGVWTAAQGTHTVEAWVDDINRIAESDETNNIYDKSIVVTAAKPDMVVTNVTWSPANPAPGDHVVFSATIKNQGAAATPSGTIDSVTFKIDGTSVSWEANYTTSIAPGGIATVMANGGPDSNNYWVATSGIHSLQTVVDDVNRIDESDETNNANYGTMMNIGTDLAVTDISWTPASPAVGNQVLFSAKIKNLGTVATPSGIINSVTFKIDGTNVSWEANYTTPLAPGASVTVTANGGPGGNKYWTATSGMHTVLAVSDDVNRIAETDETNNTYSETINIP
ncbi:MAG: hypothetical protein K0R75_3158 [Paenibacillaceae bacterium]|nr:hypothetical protein [Paenibacillaceae bacterium]